MTAGVFVFGVGPFEKEDHFFTARWSNHDIKHPPATFLPHDIQRSAGSTVEYYDARTGFMDVDQAIWLLLLCQQEVGSDTHS